MSQVSLNLETGDGSRAPLLSHNVKPFVREQVGIPEGVPVALMVHFTKGHLGYDIHKHGFVNVSGRGTLAPITDNQYDWQKPSVPRIMESIVEREGVDAAILVFCVPADLLKIDANGNYGYWYDGPISSDESPELWNIYNRIVVEYNDETGEPLKYAKDDPALYPVVIPSRYIYDVVYPTAYNGQKAGD